MIQKLLSLPAGYLRDFHSLEMKEFPEWVVSTDPPGGKLGSGGGTAHLLFDSWTQSSSDRSFTAWLNESQKLIIHAGGQSRRLPAYAPVGKISIPVPATRWGESQNVDQTLLDLQVPFFQDLWKKASGTSMVMVTSGDVLLLGKLAQMGPLPDADVVCIGMWTSAEKACSHGVFFCPREAPDDLAFFAQKPSPETIREHAAEYNFLVDTGIWLLSDKAVDVLMRKCGWDSAAANFADGTCKNYELYADFGLAFGSSPLEHDADVSALTTAVVPLPAGEFYHFGSNKDVISSCLQLQNRVLDQGVTGGGVVKPHPEMFILNSDCSSSSFNSESRALWVENSHVPDTWCVGSETMITGVPANDWSLTIPPGLCLDVVPVGEDEVAVRVYGFEDAFRGAVSAAETVYCGTSPSAWLGRRGLTVSDVVDRLECDLQQVPIFPVVAVAELDGGFVQWLLTGDAPDEASATDYRTRFLRKRLSAEGISDSANLTRLYGQRRSNLSRALPRLAENSTRSIFYRLDLNRCAHYYAQGEAPLPNFPETAQPMRTVHQQMFNAAILRRRDDPRWVDYERDAFGRLRDTLVAPLKERPVRPRLAVLDDQVVWGRSPVRLDFAGGWTDTPPFCLEHGGAVVNAAVDLNGQPPIQAFIRCCSEKHVKFRSIDLGVDEVIRTYADLAAFDTVGGPFSIPKAALCIAGFHPDFCAETYGTLEKQLDAFGCGFEISLLAALPKGSGLGTSSVLSATLLGALSDFCDLGWDDFAISNHVLLLEQLLTTGGGWQDQYGGVFRGVKLLETMPGFEQMPVVRWLPEHIFENAESRSCMMLYYTGITRVAKNILKEIVRGMFLNSRPHKRILMEMLDHARGTYDTMNRGDWAGFSNRIATSWELNQRLDSGTNPDAVKQILASVEDYLEAAKLLGAGGGGYLFMIAKDPEVALRLRRTLQEDPPNDRARFVDFTISEEGLKVTRS